MPNAEVLPPVCQLSLTRSFKELYKRLPSPVVTDWASGARMISTELWDSDSGTLIGGAIGCGVGCCCTPLCYEPCVFGPSSVA